MNPSPDPHAAKRQGFIRTLAAAMHLSSPAAQQGVRISANIDAEGWLTMAVETDESVKGWALSYNGRDIPIYVERGSDA